MNIELLESFGQNYPEEFDGVLDCVSVAVTGAFNRRGTLLAVGCNDGRVVVWDFLTRGISKVIAAHCHPVCYICWSRNGRKIITASTDNTACILDVLTGDCDNRYRFPSPILRAQFNPRDNSTFLVCPLKHPAIHCRVEGTHRIVPLGEQEDSNIVASFDKRGKFIYTGNARGKVCVFTVPGLKMIASYRIGSLSSTTTVKNIEFARKGDWFLINSSDRIIRVYNTREIVKCGIDADPEPSQKLQDLVNKTMWKKCCFSGDGEYICAGSARQHSLYIWERAVGNLVKILHGTKGEHMLDVMWHPIRPIIASISSGVVSVWSQNQVENWSAFAPDFKELDENVEYEERESEFDAEDEDKIVEASSDRNNDDLEVDVVTTPATNMFCSSDEEEEDPNALLFLPIAPDIEETEDAWASSYPEPLTHESYKRSHDHMREHNQRHHHDHHHHHHHHHGRGSSPKRKKVRVYDIALENAPVDEVHPMLGNKPLKDKGMGGKKSSHKHKSSSEKKGKHEGIVSSGSSTNSRDN